MKDVGRDLLEAGWVDGPVGLAYLAGALQRQAKVLLLAPLAALVLGLAYVGLAEPLYTATATLEIEVSDPAPDETLSPLDTQIELLRSDRVTAAVIDQLGLAEVLAPPPGLLARLFGREDDGLDEDELSLLIRDVQEGLVVRRLGNTAIVEVSYTSPGRLRSAAIANGFAAAYIGDLSAASERAVVRNTARLQARIDEVRALAADSGQEARRIQSENGFLVSSEADLEARIGELRQQLSAVAADEAALGARLGALDPRSGDDLAALEAAALQSPETLAIYSEMMGATNALAQLEEQPGVARGTIVQLEQSIAEMRTSLDRAVRRIRADLELELAVIAARRASVAAELGALALARSSGAWAELLETQRSAAVYESLHQEYLTDLEAAKAGGARDDVSLVSEVRPPVEASFPNSSVILAVALTMGVLVGAGLAAMREWTAVQARPGLWRVEPGRRPIL